MLFRSVFVNLVSNAIKFTRQRARAEIEIGCAKGSEHEAVVFVRDNGTGFDMKYVDKLFGVFQRLHHADEFEGTGIGLATVQRMIHRNGGTVRAEGSVNQGATFYLSVQKFLKEVMDNLGRILMVEDDPKDVELTMMALEGHNPQMKWL